MTRAWIISRPIQQIQHAIVVYTIRSKMVRLNGSRFRENKKKHTKKPDIGPTIKNNGPRSDLTSESGYEQFQRLGTDSTKISGSNLYNF